MSFFNLISIGVGLSMDAFAVSVCKGLCQKKMNWKNSIIIGLFFGFFQAAMPIIGYFIGSHFYSLVSGISNWIAFILLTIIGVQMLRESKESVQEEVCCDISGIMEIDIRDMIMLSVATSIDALAVGFSFALLNINIIKAASVIGILTFLISSAGVYIGHKFGSRYKNTSEKLGGIILIIIGIKILLEG